MTKTFDTMENVGRCKYIVNHHDGVKTYPDGSPFFDIRIFHNKKLRDKFVRELKAKGYTQR